MSRDTHHSYVVSPILCCSGALPCREQVTPPSSSPLQYSHAQLHNVVRACFPAGGIAGNEQN